MLCGCALDPKRLGNQWLFHGSNIQRTVKTFSILQSLRVIFFGERYNSFVSQDAAKEAIKGYPLRPIKTLSIQGLYYSPAKIFEAISNIPFLVRLEIGRVKASNLVDIAVTGQTLEYIRFNLPERCFQELNNFFIEYSYLRICFGAGHFLLADNLINGSDWTCVRLERLDIVKKGVLRLIDEQE